MHPTAVTILLALAYLAAATGAVAGLLWVTLRRMRAGVTPARAALAGFATAAAAGIVYGAVILLLDNRRTPLLNPGFVAALGAGVVAAGVALWQSAGADWGAIGRLRAVTLAILLPLVAAAPLLAALRLEGARIRAGMGCYRGYEGAWRYARTDPPDAMSTPAGAVAHYNKLVTRQLAPDDAAAHERVLTTASQKDVQWFLDNRDLIADHFGAAQPAGAGMTAAQRRVLAVALVARPVSAQVRKVKDLGGEALVLTGAGQVVWLVREGRAWKIRDFMGARSWAMDELRAAKQARGGLSPDDEHWYSILAAKTRDDLRTLCAQADIPFRDFDPAADAIVPLPAAARARPQPAVESRPAFPAPPSTSVEDGARRAADFAAALAAVPTVLQSAAMAPVPAPVPEASSAAPAGTPSPTLEPTGEKGLFGFLGKYAAHDAVDQANAATGERTAMPESLATALQTPRPPDPTAPTPTPRPENLIVPNVPVDTLWPAYRRAADMVWRGDPAGVAEFEKVISSDDREWLDRNARVIAAIVTPAKDYHDPVLPKLAALQALLRNMPLLPEAGSAVTGEDGFGMATVADAAQARMPFTTAIVQENGRWLVARFFYARDFVWVPQLALFKRARGAHLAPDEQDFLAGGFVPFQESTRRYLARLAR